MPKKRADQAFPHSIRMLRAVENYFGGRNELAKILQINPTSICRWFEEKRVSARQVAKISAITGGRVSIDELMGVYDPDGPHVSTNQIVSLSRMEK
jgi:DNA-binding transcriptional regulator YdaS (Cro superfamily)